jgi:hypothetical protein
VSHPNAWVSRATAKQPTSWARPAESPTPSLAKNAAAVASVVTTNEGSLISLGRNSDTGGFARCFLAPFVGRAGTRPLPLLQPRRRGTIACSGKHDWITSILKPKVPQRNVGSTLQLRSQGKLLYPLSFFSH